MEISTLAETDREMGARTETLIQEKASRNSLRSRSGEHSIRSK